MYPKSCDTQGWLHFSSPVLTLMRSKPGPSQGSMDPNPKTSEVVRWAGTPARCPLFESLLTMTIETMVFDLLGGVFCLGFYGFCAFIRPLDSATLAANSPLSGSKRQAEAAGW